MQKGTYVFCTTQFEYIHRWSGATGREIYLKHPHRHMFHVNVRIKVEHDNRAVEFINLKHLVDAAVIHLKEVEWSDEVSCEMMAKGIIKELKEYSLVEAYSCEVSEDRENGAIVVCQ